MMVSGNYRYTSVAKNVLRYELYFTESQYTDIPVISPTSSYHNKHDRESLSM